MALLALGVGNAPPPITLMAGAHITCLDASPFRIKPCFGQFSKNDVQPSMSDRCDVFQDDVLRSHQANDTHEFVEQPRSGALTDPSASSGLADVLARETSSDNVS
jgi:hypothetical protein